MKSYFVVAIMLVLSMAAGAMPALAQEDLTETFVSSDGALSLNYPTGWHVEQAFFSGVVFVGTTSAAVETMLNPDADLASGEAVVMIVTPQASVLIFENSVPATLDEAAKFLTEDQDTDDQFGEPVPTTIGDYDALMFDAVSADGDGIGLVMEVDGEYLLISAHAVTGEYENVSKTVLAMVETLAYTQPEGMVQVEGEGIVFEHPAGWAAFEVFAGSYMVVNDVTFANTPLAGQVVVLITAPGSLFMYGEYDDTDATTLALDFVDDFAFSDGSEITFGETEAVMIGLYEGIRITYASDGGEGVVIVLAVDDHLVTLGAATAPGELSEFEADIMRIAETVMTPARE